MAGGGEAMVGGAKNSRDRKSTRLNSSHSQISYAVFCLKKKKQNVGGSQQVARGYLIREVLHCSAMARLTYRSRVIGNFRHKLFQHDQRLLPARSAPLLI